MADEDYSCDLYGHNCKQMARDAKAFNDLYDAYREKREALNKALDALKRIRDWNDQEDADNPGDFAARRLVDIQKTENNAVRGAAEPRTLDGLVGQGGGK